MDYEIAALPDIAPLPRIAIPQLDNLKEILAGLLPQRVIQPAFAEIDQPDYVMLERPPIQTPIVSDELVFDEIMNEHQNAVDEAFVPTILTTEGEVQSLGSTLMAKPNPSNWFDRMVEWIRGFFNF